MFNSIVHSKATLEEIPRALREAPLVAIREMLTDQQILDACKAWFPAILKNVSTSTTCLVNLPIIF